MNYTIPTPIQGQVELYEHEIIANVCDALPQKILVMSSVILITWCVFDLLEIFGLLKIKETYSNKIIETVYGSGSIIMLGCVLALVVYSTLNAQGNMSVLGWASISLFAVTLLVEAYKTIKAKLKR